jgi:signal transduction histidine kinase
LATDTTLSRLHQFDPAVFTLATVPLYVDGRTVAVVWARVHIGRDLPASKLSRYLRVIVAVTLIAFLVALLLNLQQRREIRSLNAGLRTIEQDPSHRLPARSGMFGSIRQSINAMVDAIDQAHEERKELEARLHQKAKMAALGKLLAGMAHEVKTPLAILKTRVQIWQRDLKTFSSETGMEPPLSKESIQLMLDEINRLSDLLNKLLYFARRNDSEAFSPQDLNDLLRHTILFVKPRILQQKTDLEVDLDDGPVEVLGDADGLHQVFLNVLTNSLQAMDERGRLTVRSRRDDTAGTVRVEVRDTGPGIDPKVLGHVFDPFFTTRHGGTGLGLSIAYEIMQAHGGEIHFAPVENGQGTLCVLTLPLVSAKEASP